MLRALLVLFAVFGRQQLLACQLPRERAVVPSPTQGVMAQTPAPRCSENIRLWRLTCWHFPNGETVPARVSCKAQISSLGL